jgi:predicted house-cleaning noncanonical NTP pyrophosphatase (MazG superfamily)
MKPGTRVKMIRDSKSKPRDEHEQVKPINSALGHSVFLLFKIFEEVLEVQAAPTDVYEYADVLECLYKFGNLHGITPDMMEQARIDKKVKVGGFDRGLVLARLEPEGI